VVSVGCAGTAVLGRTVPIRGQRGLRRHCCAGAQQCRYALPEDPRGDWLPPGSPVRWCPPPWAAPTLLCWGAAVPIRATGGSLYARRPAHNLRPRDPRVWGRWGV